MIGEPIVIVGPDRSKLLEKARELSKRRVTVTTVYESLVSDSLRLTWIMLRGPAVVIVENVPDAQYAMDFLMLLASTKMLTPAIVERRCEPRPVPDFIFCVPSTRGLRAVVNATVINVD